MLLMTQQYHEAPVHVGPGAFLILVLLSCVSIVSIWKLFEKSGTKGYYCLLPIWNFMVLLRLLGRPQKHVLYLLVPIYNLYFFGRILIELATSFNKTSRADYTAAIVLNLLFIINLGLSHDIQYKGPSYLVSESPD